MNISPSWLQNKQKCLEVLELLTSETKVSINADDGEEVRASLERYMSLMGTLSETKASLRFYYKSNNSAENDALWNRSVDLFETVGKGINALTTILSYNKQQQLLERR